MFRLRLSVAAVLLFAAALLFVVELADSSSLGAGPMLSSLPDGAIQPEALVDPAGNLHLVYFTGEDTHGDLYYVRSSDGGKTFSAPLRVNSQPGSAIAAGAIRGAQIALGADARLHVVWNGSSIAKPKGPPNPEAPPNSPHSGLPLLYSRLDLDGDGFEPQRNVMTRTFGLDGGGAVTADGAGNVYVAWHGKAAGAAEGEAGRQVFLTQSSDGGGSFSPERAISEPGAGACACCAMRLFAGSDGTVYGLFRTATDVVRRDMVLLVSKDHGKTFAGRRIHEWEIGSCPMTSMSMVEGAHGVLAAWETKGQVWWARLSSEPGASIQPFSPEGDGGHRKHPRLAVGPDGSVLLSWAEIPGWKKPGLLSWQLFAPDGTRARISSDAGALPVWSFAAPFWNARARGFGLIR